MPKKKKRIPLKNQILSVHLSKWKKEQIKDHTNSIEPTAVIYCRVSNVQQVTYGNGLTSQEDKCTEWCQNQSPTIEINKIFKEPWVTWASLDRPALNECIQYIKKQNSTIKRISHFVITEASRLSRPEDIAEAFQLEDRISSLGVKIVKVDSPGVDENTDEWTFLKTIMYAVAGYERKKINQRCLDWKISKLKNWYWPFANPPLGYVRKKSGTKDYNDIVEPVSWAIIKEWLELFASNVLSTQTDLRKFRDKKGLRPNWQTKTKRLRKSFPGKVFYPHRLFYYAWYIYYPTWGIDEPIEWKHVWLISLQTAYAIIKKLRAIQVGMKRYRSASQLTDKFPLKWAIICTECGRKYTARSTTKKKEVNWKQIIKSYPYYWCMNTYCKEKPNIPKDKIEEEFRELLTYCNIWDTASNIINVLFSKESKKLSFTQRDITSNKRSELKKLTQKQAQIEQTMIKTKNEKLLNKFQEERENIEERIQSTNDSIENEDDIYKTTKFLLGKLQKLFENPVQMREEGSPEMRKTLFAVLSC